MEKSKSFLCKKTFGDADMFPTDNTINKFYKKDSIYKATKTEDGLHSMSIFGIDSKGIERDIVSMYPLKDYELELFFEQIKET